jgi:tetratricopeptide (TPR) repeat protein
MKTDNGVIEGSPDGKDFFISYNSADTGWAEWIAWVLEEQGFSVHVQAWDFQPGNNFVHEMQTGAARAERTIALLSPGYLASRFTSAEWYAAFSRDPTGEKRLLIPFRVQVCQPEGLLGPIVYRDLTAVTSEARARELVLSAVQLQRPKSKPAFPVRSANTASPSTVRFPGREPDFWNPPRIRNPNFTGRDELLNGLRESLRQGGRSALTAVAGLGGIGKTQTALEYAYRFAADYDVIWWIRAETPATRVADLRALAHAAGLEDDAADGEVGIPRPDETRNEENDGRSLARRLRPWLAERRWLVILDNASAPGEVEWMLHEIGPGGHVLITSRALSWRRLGAVVQVPPLGTDEAARFLLDRSGRAHKEAELPSARELARALGELPLALEQTAAYMEHHRKPPAEYLKLYQKHRLQLLDRGIGDDQRTVSSTWGISLDAIEAAKPAAIELMRVLSLLAPDEIPLDLIRSHAAEVSLTLAATAMDDLEWDELVEVLLRHSLITDLQAGSVAVHRLVQDVVHAGMEAGEAERLLSALWRILSLELPHSAYDHTNFPAFALLVPHVEALLARSGGRLDTGPMGWWLAIRVSSYFLQRGALREARIFAERAVEATESDSDASGGLASSLSTLGRVLQDQGDLPGARDKLERALEIDERAYGPDHPRVAVDLNNLGSVLQDQGDLTGARENRERALGMDERVYGPNHPRVATLLNDLGLVLQDQGDLAGAREKLEHALEVDERVYGPDHPIVAIRLNNLGLVLQDQSDLTGAREKLERALEMDERVYGPDHPTVAIRLNNLGNLLQEQGDLTSAREKLERALEITERVYSPDHSFVAGVLNNLGGVLQDQGNLAGAQEKLERALAIDLRTVGEQHWYAGVSHHRLGDVLVASDSLSDGIENLERGLDILQRRLAPEHYRVARVLDSLGVAYGIAGRLDDAEQAHRRAVEIRTSSLGAEAYPTAWSKRLLAMMLVRKGETAEARTLLESAYAACLGSLGSDHPKTRQIETDLADLASA